MTKATDASSPLVLAQLYYEHPIEAVDWLCRVFGFNEESRLSGPGGELYLAVLGGPDGGSVMVCDLATIREQMAKEFADDFRDIVGTPWPNLFYSLTIMVAEVDQHFALARSEGARVLTEPTDQPWGLRDYEVLDLEGRQWNFSQRIRDTVPEDWGATSTDRT